MYDIYLNWVHIVGDDDQLGLLVLHQGGDGVHTCREEEVKVNFCSTKDPAHKDVFYILADTQS